MTNTGVQCDDCGVCVFKQLSRDAQIWQLSNLIHLDVSCQTDSDSGKHLTRPGFEVVLLSRLISPDNNRFSIISDRLKETHRAPQDMIRC